MRSKVACSVLLILVAVFLVMATSPARAEVTTNEKIQMDMYVGFVCPDGSFHLIHLSGYMHALYVVTLNDNGFHAKYHYQPQGLSGLEVDPFTLKPIGAKYQGVGVTQGQKSGKFDGPKHEYTEINNFRLIGQGNACNYMVHWTMHVTINANGEVTSEVQNVKITCK